MEFEKTDIAREYYQKIISCSFAESSYKGRAYHNIAQSYSLEKDYISSKDFYLKAVTEKQIKNKPSELFITYTDLAQTYMMLGDFDQAMTYGKKAELYYNDVYLLETNYRVFYLLSEIAHEQQNFDLDRIYKQRYVTENKAFLGKQRQILKENERFKIELVLAGYNQEINSNDQISSLNQWLIALIIMGLLIPLLMRLRGEWKKRILEKELIEAMEDVDLD